MRRPRCSAASRAYLPRSLWPSVREGIADLIVSKHRNGGLGDVELTFQKEYPRFMSYVGDDRY